jgi:hypothetical protein
MARAAVSVRGGVVINTNSMLLTMGGNAAASASSCSVAAGIIVRSV